MKRTFLTDLAAFALTSMLGAGQALAASFDVSVNNDDGSGGTSGTLSWAIRQANLAGPVAQSITLKSDVTLTARMRQLIEQSVTIQADSSARQITCNAGSGGQPFFIGGGLAGSTTSGVSYPALPALSVTLKGLTVSGCSAKGGDGRTTSGGGGAGLGGAVFIYGGNVSLQSMRFDGNAALGRNGNVSAALGSGCGGMFGDANSIDGGGLWASASTCGALFICTSDLSGSCSASIDAAHSCGISFASNSASNGQANYDWSGHPTALDSYVYACDTKVSSIAIDPISPSIVYSGLDGAGVFKSSNSGSSWLDANGSSPSNLGNLRVKALLIKPGSSNTLFAATYGGGVFKSVNSAAGWSACDTASLGNLNVLSLAMNSSASTLYVGTETGVYVSSNDCTSWAAMNTGFPQ